MAKASKKEVKKEVTKPEISALIKPRVTEKAVLLSESRGVYAFNVVNDATRKSVTASVKAKYKVTPVKVRLLSIKPKQKITAGKPGMRRGGRKAYVYLKKGDKIDVV